MTTLLESRIAVVYGGGGAIGGAVARTFAREGARVFLAGRTAATLAVVAEQIRAAGGAAEVDEVDAGDEAAVEAHADSVVRRAGRIDVAFNAVGIPQQGVQGTPVVDLPLADFRRPVVAYTTAQFLTARAAARRMLGRGSGVILTVTGPRGGDPNVGAMGAVWAAMEALSRTLAAEVGPHGIRVVSVRAHGLPETATVRDVLGLHAAHLGLPPAQLQAAWESQTLLRRLPTLAEVAEAAAFLASDRAGATTGAVANLTAGAMAD
jgi:NAD(P)-dependent dehydrogenase (short-subunit alcohol dehydrogenase family)